MVPPSLKWYEMVSNGMNMVSRGLNWRMWYEKWYENAIKMMITGIYIKS